MKKIMVIDDEEDIIELIKAILGKDYKVIGANNGKDGLAKAKENKPDFIFLDVMMPDMDGWETLDRLKEDNSTKEIPVAMLTVRSLSMSLKQKEIEHVVDYVTKPFSKEDIVETLKQVSMT